MKEFQMWNVLYFYKYQSLLLLMELENVFLGNLTLKNTSSFAF